MKIESRITETGKRVTIVYPFSKPNSNHNFFVVLNSVLIKQQKCEENIQEIAKLHYELQSFFKRIEKTPVDKLEKVSIVKEIERIEFAMQKQWKFEQNSNYHTYWYRVPHCTCPTMDNDDLMGCAARYYNSHCPIHGK